MKRLFKEKGNVYLTNHEVLQWLDEKHAEDEALAAANAAATAATVAQSSSNGRATSPSAVPAKQTTRSAQGLPPLNALKATKDVRKYLSHLPGSSLSPDAFLVCLDMLRKATFLTKEEKLMCLNTRPSAVGELTLVLFFSFFTSI